jgi:hypothetical protein
VRARAAQIRGELGGGLFETILYPGISHRTSWVDQDGMLWLNRQLHFALWDDAAIRSAGTTHISDWIRENHVDISPNYIREDREGGLDAVGRGFPGIPRASLMVLPDTVWEQQKQELIYDSWAAKARALERKNKHSVSDKE